MSQPGPSPAGKSPVPTSRLLRGLDRAARLALVIAIGLCGWSLVRTARDLFAPMSAASPAAAGADADATELVALLPGGWSFEDSTWTFRSGRVSPREAAERMRALGESGGGGAGQATLERTVLEWLRRATRPRREGALTVYEAARGGGQVRAVSEGTGDRERLRLVQLFQPEGDRDGELIEARPRLGAARAGGDLHLLPLPSGVASVARRWDEKGRLTGELVGPVSADRLASHWRSAGWSVATGEKLVCRRGRETVLAWKWGGPGGAAAEYLLLVPVGAAGGRSVR